MMPQMGRHLKAAGSLSHTEMEMSSICSKDVRRPSCHDGSVLEQGWISTVTTQVSAREQLLSCPDPSGAVNRSATEETIIWIGGKQKVKRLLFVGPIGDYS